MQFASASEGTHPGNWGPNAAPGNEPEQPPCDRGFDHTLGFLRRGYEFISLGCARHRSPVFMTRLLGRRVICMRGAEAARFFYDQDLFERQGAAPGRVIKTLFGTGGIQALDGAEHRHRKAMFMSMMTRQRVDALSSRAAHELEKSARTWQRRRKIRLLDALRPVLFQAGCDWAGIPIKWQRDEVHLRDLVRLVDAASALGPSHWRARRARKRSEEWAAGLVRSVRSESLEPEPHSPLSTVAQYRDLDGELLPLATAATELLNVIRPIVAIAHIITFGALALHHHPEAKARLKDGDSEEMKRFVQEVRRCYPMFPVVAARTKKNFEFAGYTIPANTRVLLDLFGTNHDGSLWKQPQRFDPRRFENRQVGPFDLVPQGGGQHDLHHRCAGEWLTVSVTEACLEVLLFALRYEVPKQDLTVVLSRMPTAPSSGFVIRKVQRMSRPQLPPETELDQAALG